MSVAQPSFGPANARGSVVEGHEVARTVVWLRGEHDIDTEAELSATFARLIASDDADLVVDLSEVQFIDASTVGVIVRARNFLHPRSRSLSVRAPARCARRVLDACGLAGLIETDQRRSISETSGALGSWVVVPAIDRVDSGTDEPATAAPATSATPADIEQAGETTTVPVGSHGP